MSETIIGIDLGTSTTEAAIYRDGKTEMILTFDNKAIVPSVVGIDESGNWVVGERAKAQLLLSPEKTAMEVKRKIGKGEDIILGGQPYTPAALSAKILEYVRTYAGHYLGEEVSRAVVSVPAYFDDIQRHETLLSGTMAGFQVERILNEPTAAALCYGLDHMDEESHVLVYDLGGGTFDVTLLEMFEGILEVKASSGDNELGGKDFDQKVIDYLVKKFRDSYGIDLNEDRHAMVRIRDEAEACKIALSTDASYRIQLPMIAKKEGRPLAIDETISAEQFRSLTADLVARTHRPIDVVLSDGGITPSQIDHIILVGGSTRMPMIAQDIASYLGKEPSRAVDPDYAVAQGAAIMAAMIEGKIDPAEGLVMTDVNPYTLGLQVFDGFSYDVMSVVIPRNVTIPVEKTRIYRTYEHNQREADIRVYQGESEIASSNHFLGEFRIGGIPPKKAGKEKIRVTFSYDINGLLNVSAVIESTGHEASIQINMNESAPEDPFRDDEEMVDISKWKDVEGSEPYRAIIRRTERLIRQGRTFKEKEVTEAVDSLQEVVDLLKRTIVLEEWESAEKIEAELKSATDVMDSLIKLMS